MSGRAFWLAACALLAPLACAAAPPAPAADPSADTDTGRADPGRALKLRFVGPRAGNRVAAVAGVPGDPSTYYAGAASGGVWKSTDGGNRWEPLFDGQSSAAIGALAVAPSAPATVWAGTGEAWAIRDSDVMGDGIYKSTDGGASWTNMGLPESGRIGRIIVHPTNPDIVYACVLGRTTGPQQDKGVYRSIDGGSSWKLVLFGGVSTGCSGLSMDAHNPLNLIAGLWQVEMHPWAQLSGGPGSTIWSTHDGGLTWTRVEDEGLPHAPLGKIDVAIAPSNGSRIYALIQTKDQGSLWRSDDAGVRWHRVSSQRALIGRAGYYIHLAVSPANDNEVLVANSSLHQSLDGGETFHETSWGGDTHDIWIDPVNPDRFVITDDGGLNVTTVHGRGFHQVSLPVGQMYHVDVDDQIPYYVYSNMQDDGNLRAPMSGGGSDESGWDRHMGGCESGFTVPDPADPDVVWATCYGDSVTRWDARSRQAHSVSPWRHTLDSPPNGLKYRCHWTPPLALDPFDHRTVYYGCQVIFRTQDAGQSWTVISPDLSTRDPAHLVPSGGLAGDNLGQFYGEVVFAIAPSKVQQGLIWAGTNDGKLWYTADAGAHWNDVTSHLAGLPPGGVVTSIAPSSTDAATAYVAIDLHLSDNRDPFLYKTADLGKTWKRISGDLPRHELSYVRTVTDDPAAPGLLFAGTGNGLFYSLDDGSHWKPLKNGLPPAPVTWAVVQKRFHDLVISTYGRGLYILDDVTPLEQLARHEVAGPVALLAPRDTYRFVRRGGAVLHFSLAQAPKAPVTLEIQDSQNVVVRTLQVRGAAGLNRVKWDLRHTAPRLVALRTVAPDNPRIWQEPRFRNTDSRPVTHWGIEDAQTGPIAVPGKYTVRLTVDGQRFTQPLTLLPDPKAPGTAADLQQSVKTLLTIRDAISHVADAVNHVEWVRRQLEVLRGMLRPAEAAGAAEGDGDGGGGSEGGAKGDEDSGTSAAAAPPRTLSPEEEKQRADLLAAVQRADGKLEAAESRLVSRSLRNSDDKYFAEADGVYLDLIWLNAEVGTGGGDVAGGADFAPTAAQLESLHELEAQIASVDGELKELFAHEIATLDEALAHAHLATVALSPGAATGAYRPGS